MIVYALQAGCCSRLFSGTHTCICMHLYTRSRFDPHHIGNFLPLPPVLIHASDLIGNSSRLRRRRATIDENVRRSTFDVRRSTLDARRAVNYFCGGARGAAVHMSWSSTLIQAWEKKKQCAFSPSATYLASYNRAMIIQSSTGGDRFRFCSMEIFPHTRHIQRTYTIPHAHSHTHTHSDTWSAFKICVCSTKRARRAGLKTGIKKFNPKVWRRTTFLCNLWRLLWWHYHYQNEDQNQNDTTSDHNQRRTVLRSY